MANKNELTEKAQVHPIVDQGVEWMVIKIPKTAWDVLANWASVGRTIDAAVRLLQSTTEDDEKADVEPIDYAIRELLDLKQPLSYCNDACRDRKWDAVDIHSRWVVKDDEAGKKPLTAGQAILMLMKVDPRFPIVLSDLQRGDFDLIGDVGAELSEDNFQKDFRRILRIRKR